MKYIASCSCGKDSLAMILSLIEKDYPLDYVVFFDGGKEFNSIYRNWNKLTVLLDKHNIKHIVLKPECSFDYYFSEHITKTNKKGYSWSTGKCLEVNYMDGTKGTCDKLPASYDRVWGE